MQVLTDHRGTFFNLMVSLLGFCKNHLCNFTHVLIILCWYMVVAYLLCTKKATVLLSKALNTEQSICIFSA